MRKRPLVSIITVALNSAATICDTMQSVVEQSYMPLEHIVIDGDSSDSTLEVVESFRTRYVGERTLRIISEKDEGKYVAMNKGLRLAKGDLVGFLNSDDYFSATTALETLMEGFSADVDAVYADVKYVAPDNCEKIVRKYSCRRFHRRKMLMGCQPAHPAFYCRRKKLNESGGFDTTFPLAADFELLLRLIYCEQIKIKYIPMDCVTMRIGGASTSGWDSWRQIMRDHLAAYHKNRVPANRFTDVLRFPGKFLEYLV